MGFGVWVLRFMLVCRVQGLVCVYVPSFSHERNWRGLHASIGVSPVQLCGFPNIRGTILGVPIIRTIVFGGLYWGPPILGNYPVHSSTANGT